MKELLWKKYYILRFEWDTPSGWSRMANRASRTPLFPAPAPDSGDFHTESHWVQDAVFSGTLVPLNWPYRIIILLFEIKLCRVLNFITEFNINNYLQFNEFRYLLNCFWVVPLNLLKRRRTYSFNEQQKSLALTSAYILFSINQL